MSKIAVYPGSFDPVTFGHVDIVTRSLQLFDEVILAIATNSKKSCLFTVQERFDLLHQVVGGLERLRIDTFEGLTVEYAQRVNATTIVRGLRAVTDFDYEYAISLMNRKLAPNVDTVFLMASNEHSFISSTIVKEVARHGRDVTGQVPEEVNTALLKKFPPQF